MRFLLAILFCLLLSAPIPASARRLHAARVVTCPDGCGMGLVRRRDAGHPMAVSFQGRRLYCCGTCNFARAARRVAAGHTRHLACPDGCGMGLTAHRDARHPLAVRLQGHTLYCCGTCNFSKTARQLARR